MKSELEKEPISDKDDIQAKLNGNPYNLPKKCLQNTNNSQGDRLKSEKQTIIRRARLFQNDDFLKNIEILQTKAREVGEANENPRLTADNASMGSASRGG